MSTQSISQKWILEGAMARGDSDALQAGGKGSARTVERRVGSPRRSRAAVRALAVATVVLTADCPAFAQATPLPPASRPLLDPMLAPPAPAPHTVASWDDALALVRTRSPEYLAAYQSIVRAAAQHQIAVGRVQPTLNAQASYVHNFFIEAIPFDGATLVAPPKNVLAITGAAQWNVNPRDMYALGTTARSTMATRLGFDDARRLIAVSVVRAMLSTLAAQRVADLNRVGLRAAFERLALTKARLEFGQGTPLDTERAAQDVAAARSLVVTGDESLRQTREQLGAALGSATPIAAPGDLNLEEFEAAVARTCRLNDEIERRPDVAAARARLEVAERGVTDAELMFAPSLSFGSTAQAATASTLGPLNTWSLQAAISVPLYDGGVRYGARRDAEATLEQARQALLATRVAAIVSAAQAARSIGVAAATRDIAKGERALAERIDRRVRDSYAGGSGTSLDLVLSAQALRQAELKVMVLEVEASEARALSALASAQCVY